MHKFRRASAGETRRAVGHHWGQVPRPSGHNPWTTNPKRPLRPEHCIRCAACPSRPLQNSGDQLSASVYPRTGTCRAGPSRSTSGTETLRGTRHW